ncbi:hypothetical protein K439DRAFT_1360978 [Ramaria rubella]|nr:hypothetical protein K439DRAFT_1360978 [Ramaria rubella]
MDFHDGNTNLPLVAVVGTCDTKHAALVFIKQLIISSGLCDAILIDVGSYEPADSSKSNIDIPRQEILDRVVPVGTGRSRNEVSGAMAQGLRSLLKELRNGTPTRRSISGVIAAGGSCNTSLCAQAFREALPVGFPKLMVSTMASGDVSHYVGESDITMMHSVVDVAGLNHILESVLKNAANAIAAMAANYSPASAVVSSQRAIAVTMFGVTTPCVEMASKLLEELGYTPVIFHATGTGGLAMERLISEGKFVGVLDLTTTELADELVGGVLSAGPNRLEAAARAGIPQVVSVGAMDMVNFGPKATVPEKFKFNRVLHEHNSSVTLMRTTKSEAAELGKTLANKVNIAPQSTHVLLPLRGISLIDVKDAPFYDPDADKALFVEVRRNAQCSVSEYDVDINDPQFARAAVHALHTLFKTK